MNQVNNLRRLRGGEFLIGETPLAELFIPEAWNEEQQQVAQLFSDFVDTVVLPRMEALEAMDPPSLLPQLLKQAGEQGMLGVAVPEAYGGFGLDFLTGMYTTEQLGRSNAFSVALLAHAGIGTLPILYFGNEAQKQRYLPKLATGELLAAYCLTEPGSGSDALGARTKAVLNAAGTHYVLNGQKMWITNGGFADVFIVFAKIDGEHFTGFIVERNTPGLSFGEEEHKMGIKGSSTRQVFLADVEVPVENVLGEIGKGHLIAFNILNIGRIKLAAAVLGGAKQVATLSISYANERHQFNRPISSFGAIQHKLAEQAIRIYALESAVYRASADIQAQEHELQAQGKNLAEALLGAAQEYAAECAILKVFGSEVLDFVVDEGVQIYGGYGYSAEYPMERPYRDSRINRIFEGTNEINRMLAVDYILKKGLKGELNLMGPALAVQKELMSIPDLVPSSNGHELAEDHAVLKNLKKAVLMTAGAAVQKFQKQLADEQEVLMGIADMLIQLYVAESIYLRVIKLKELRGAEAIELPRLMCQVFVRDAAERVAQAAKPVLHYLSGGDEQRILLMGLKRFTKTHPFDTIGARRRIAAHLIESNRYPF
jgi:alkylation response protein AidB-like acyl-CoA dehydrogenase